jgi:predicted DNA-binding protein YlxM (UPF0122 family)
MSLDIERRRRLGRLFELYGPLLTEHQVETLGLLIERDWSYAEIAAAQGVSRAAVYDLVRRSEALLEGFEKRLGLDGADAGRVEALAALNAKLDGIESELRSLRRAVKAIN